MAARRRLAVVALAATLLYALLPTVLALAAEHDVEIVDFDYEPDQLDVAAGDTVTWTNNDVAPHTVTSLPGATEEFDAFLEPGETFTYTFAEDGYNPYWCTLHPDMRADVLVGDAQRPAPLDTSPLQADDAIGAAIAYSQRAFPEGNADGAALLGRDDLFADSLSSGGVQGAVGAPLLLTGSDELDERVAEELARLAVGTVWILGGTQAVSDAVADALHDAGYEVDRLDGATRIETAVDAARTVLPDAEGAILARAHAGSGDPTQAFADSLGAGAMAAATGRPVLLSETERLSTATAAYLQTSAVETVTVIGGEMALSAQVVTDLEALGLDVERIGGQNRVETAALIAAQLATQGPSPDAVVVVDGQSDLAWAAGFPAAVLGLPVALADGDSLPPPTTAMLSQLGGLDVAPLCGPFLAEGVCSDAAAAASAVDFFEEGFRLAGLEGVNVVDAEGIGDQGDPDATAAAYLLPTDRVDTICYALEANPPVDFTAAYVAQGAPGERGETVIAMELAPGPFGFLGGCTFDADAATLEAIGTTPGDFYVELVSEAYPDGVLRGQLFEATFIIGTELTPEAEVPGPGDPSAEASGFGEVVGKSDTEVCAHTFVTGLSSPVTAAHIHVGAPDVAGPVVLPLRTPVSPGDTYGCYTAAAELVTALREQPEDYYMNVHTEERPAGAVRGQLSSFE